jgi:uncharacterized protein YdgA (DUF945 family)
LLAVSRSLHASILSNAPLNEEILVKKSVIALILLAVVVIIISPAIVGKFAEESVGENLNWAANESGELVVTSEGFDRGWFSSEGRHRVELGDGQVRAAMTTVGGAGNDDQLPVLLINTHIDHGLIPVSSMGREEGSLAPGLGSAVSTLAVEFGDETIDLPGTIYSKVGMGGDLDSKYIVAAGAQTVDNGEVTWQPTTINIASSAKSGDMEFDGDIGAMTFGNQQQVVAIDGLSFTGEQEGTPYGFHVGDVDMTMGAMTITSSGMEVGGMKGMSVKASSSVNDGIAAAAMRMELSGQTIPGFGDISVIADMTFDSLDAEALGVLTAQLENMGASQDPTMLMMEAQDELKGLVAGGLNVDINQFDVALPMGTVEVKMTLGVPESDRSAFEWTSLLLVANMTLDIKVPEALIQLASSMDPQVGAIVGMGYLKKDGDVYIMDADFKKGLLTINGAPIPIPMGAFQ